MAKALNDWHQAVIDEVDCDPYQRGCPAEKGGRCITATGKRTAYPHKCRQEAFEARLRNKAMKPVPQQVIKQIAEELPTGGTVIIDGLSHLQKATEIQVAAHDSRVRIMEGALRIVWNTRMVEGGLDGFLRRMAEMLVEADWDEKALGN